MGMGDAPAAVDLEIIYDCVKMHFGIATYVGVNVVQWHLLPIKFLLIQCAHAK